MLMLGVSLDDYTMCSFAQGNIICWNMLVTTTASVSTYQASIVELSLLQTSQNLQSKTFEINVHESDIDFGKRVVPVWQIIEILLSPSPFSDTNFFFCFMLQQCR